MEIRFRDILYGLGGPVVTRICNGHWHYRYKPFWIGNNPYGKRVSFAWGRIFSLLERGEWKCPGK